jgi:hypothetical protein
MIFPGVIMAISISIVIKNSLPRSFKPTGTCNVNAKFTASKPSTQLALVALGFEVEAFEIDGVGLLMANLTVVALEILAWILVGAGRAAPVFED